MKKNEIFKKVLVEKSAATNYDEAVYEWRMSDIVQISAATNCICTQNIKKFHTFTHKTTFENITVGVCCFKKFLPSFYDKSKENKAQKKVAQTEDLIGRSVSPLLSQYNLSKGFEAMFIQLFVKNQPKIVIDDRYITIDEYFSFSRIELYDLLFMESTEEEKDKNLIYLATKKMFSRVQSPADFMKYLKENKLYEKVS